jgi:CheY-like chemotaxis protein
MARILLVEDEEVQRKVLESILKTAEHQVLLAGNGAQALLLAKDKKPDLVLSDMAMPKMSGKELCEAIRATPGIEGTYVILVTAMEGEIPRLETMLAGADDFVRKPVQKEDLVHRVGIGVAMRGLRREVAELKAGADAAARSQDLLAASLDLALRGIEDAQAKLNNGDAVAAMNLLRASYESVRASLAKIALPEG